MRWHIGVGLGLLSLAGGMCTAAGPGGRISLSLRQNTLSQAVQALSRASGQPVRLNIPPGREPAQRRSFEWSHVPFGRALRELCTAYHLSCRRRLSAYELEGEFPSVFPPGSPQQAPAFQKQAVRLFVTDAGWAGYTLPGRFPRLQIGSPGPTTLGLDLRCELDDQDSARLAGIANVVARDDCGNLLSGQYQNPSLLDSANFPDQWYSRIELPHADLHARKLLWLQGDLLAYRTFIRPLLEVPFAPGAAPARRQSEGFAAVVLCRPALAVTAAQPRAPDSGPSVQLRLSRSLKPGDRAQGATPEVELVGASGAVYPCHSSSCDGSRRGGKETWQVKVKFPPVDERITRVRIRTLLRDDPQPFLTFRTGMLALPRGRAALPPLTGSQPHTAKGRPPAVGAARLTLTLNHASLAECIRAIEKAGGPRLRVAGAPLAGRHSFQWDQAPVGRALREVCSAFGMTCRHANIGYVLIRDTVGRPSTPPAGVGTFQQAGFLLHVTRKRCEAMGAALERRLILDLACTRADGGTPGATEFANVVAMDDQGRLVSFQDHRRGLGGVSQGYPDEWSGRISFAKLDGRARKLAWIEGEVLGHRTSDAAMLVLPFSKGPSHQRVGNLPFDVLCRREKHTGSPVVEIRYPKLAGGNPTFAGELIMGDGQVRSEVRASIGSDRATIFFPPVARLPVRLRLQAEPYVEPQRLLRFRLTGVSLPPTIPARAPAAVEAKRLAATWGTVRFAVGDGRKLPPGSAVDVQLTPLEKGKVARLEIAPIAPDGMVYLRDVPAGRYRVSRWLQRGSAPAGGSPPEDAADLLTVTVTAGKTTSAPPLQVPGPPARPKAAGSR